MPNSRIVDTLIIVCCHAIWLGEDSMELSAGRTVEHGWLIEPFQVGETGTFIDHIQAGLEQLSQNRSAILVFSGGSTKAARTPVSEAHSYYHYAMEHGLLVEGDVLDRTFTENDATDSFQNVLFSLLRFPQFVKQSHLTFTDGKGPEDSAQLPYPQRLLLISHEFKRARFKELHLPALRYPIDPSRFEYIGINPPFDEKKMHDIQEGDAKRGYGAWSEDLYGRRELLAGKRVARGWTELAKESFVTLFRNWLAGNAGMDARVKSQFEKVIAFTEDDSTTFPEIAPWT